jgi:hypothetical protein
MGAAEVISFEEVRARQPRDTLRQQLHERALTNGPIPARRRQP